MQIAMIGTAYLGLASGACFADFGHSHPRARYDPITVRMRDASGI